jgi:serine/threonine protein kinase
MQHSQVPLDPEFDEARSLIGTTVANKWRVLRLLGVGGAAAVYAAVHVNNGRRVALKVLHRSVAHAEDVRERFFEEAFAANRIDHSGTVPALDDGSLADGRPFLVLELLEGENLNSMWERRGRALPIREVLHIGQAVLSVVGAAHGKGILHRDIKPENLFVSVSGEIKLLDFGIAKMTDSQRAYKTKVGDAMGTPAFMPPEQARGRWGEVDERSDLWAIAATLFTLITGRFIHEGGTTNEVLLSAMCHPAPPLVSICPNVPECVARVVDRGLSYDKADRFATAREMYDAIGECLAQLPLTISEPPPQSERRRKWETHEPGVLDVTELDVPKKKTKTTVIFFAVVATILGIAGFTGASVEDVRTLLIRKPDGVFAYLPWDPVIHADRTRRPVSGTFQDVGSATQVAFSDDARAVIDREETPLTDTRLVLGSPITHSDSDAAPRDEVFE